MRAAPGLTRPTLLGLWAAVGASILLVATAEGQPFSAQIQRAIRGLTTGATPFTQLNANTVCLDAANKDTCLTRGASAGFLRLTNSGTFAISNGSNPEYGFLQWSSNAFTIGTFTNGGTTRNVNINSAAGIVFLANGAARLNINGNGDLATGSSTGTIVLVTSTPTRASGFASSGTSVAGIASAFNVTIGTTPSATGTINYNRTFGNVPSCVCTNTVTNNPVQCVPTTTQAVLNGVWIASDVIRCLTLGY